MCSNVTLTNCPHRHSNRAPLFVEALPLSAISVYSQFPQHQPLRSMPDRLMYYSETLVSKLTDIRSSTAGASTPVYVNKVSTTGT